MASPDLDAPARVSHLSAAKSPFGFLRCCVSSVLIFSFTFAGAAQCRTRLEQVQDQVQAQNQVQAPQDPSVSEAARQERARKQSLQKKSKHVYTAEDLKREHILVPEDRAELEAHKHQSASPANPQDGFDSAAVAQDANATSPSSISVDVPLGDVARRLRRQKESQQLQRSAQFPLPFADAPVLASPKPPAQPLLPSLTVDPPTAVPPAPRVVVPLRPFVKRSPFERPRVLPAPPVAPRTLAAAPPALVPAPRTPRVVPMPPSVRVAPAPAISGKLTVVIVKPGDSLWKFAASRLGDGRRWQELLSFNPGLRDPNVLKVGSEIVLPASFAAPRTPTQYAVRHGDTLWTIAQAQLGTGTAWACIAKANPDLRDANRIQQSQVLLLPSSCLP